MKGDEFIPTVLPDKFATLAFGGRQAGTLIAGNPPTGGGFQNPRSRNLGPQNKRTRVFFDQLDSPSVQWVLFAKMVRPTHRSISLLSLRARCTPSIVTLLPRIFTTRCKKEGATLSPEASGKASPLVTQFCGKVGGRSDETAPDDDSPEVWAAGQGHERCYRMHMLDQINALVAVPSEGGLVWV